MKKLLAILIIGIICVPMVLAETDLLEQGSTIGFRVNVDRDGIIRNAFTTALSAAGLKNDNNNSNYLLNVNITIMPRPILNNQNVMVQFELNADLLDSDGRVLLPYSFSIREGHNDQARAEERAFREAVRKINAEYKNLLNDITVAGPVQAVQQGSIIGFRVNADRDGIIQNAFTTAFSAAGLKNDNNNSGYLLNVNITITPINVPNNQNWEFVRLVLIANLVDSNGRVLLPYTFDIRQGYHTQAGAEERVFLNAERKINAEYGNLLNDIISR